MRQHEFSKIAEHWRKELSLHLLAVRDQTVIECPDSHLYDPRSDVFLAEHLPQFSFIEDVIPAKLGWIEVTPPREDDKVLLIAQLGTKTSWYDLAARTECSNDNVLKLFKKAAKPLRKALSYPVWARHVDLVDQWHPYRDIGYSAGAAKWAKGGGELRQWGVKNVVYSVSPDSPPPKGM
jgi:hypothetical protein